MSKKWRTRELMWMTLPVALLGGVAWWFGNGGQSPFSPSTNSTFGPPRIEFGKFGPVKLSPYEVSQGYDWAASTAISDAGTWSKPPGWKLQKIGIGLEKVVYRRGAKWEEATSINNVLPVSSNGVGTFRVKLETVPRDAQEVRLRSKFRRDVRYTGPIPPGWKPPKNMRIKGKWRILTLESKPFDIQIKGPKEPFPQPDVSREPTLRLHSVGWRNDGDGLNFVLGVRRTDGTGLTVAVVNNRRLTDAQGRVAVDNGKGFGNLGCYNVPNSKSLFVSFDNPFSSSHFPISPPTSPLRLRAEISDGQSWPLSIDVRVTKPH